jgi:RNA polymerase sigma-70 factor (ECF subfamily)
MDKKITHREKDFGLVQRALCGDQSAFSMIFKKYNVILTVQISEIVTDSEQASDIVMETFEKAFERLKNFQPDYKLSAWLVRIGRNCAIDYCRRQSRTNIVSIDDSFDDSENDRPTLQIMDDSRTPEEELSYTQRIEFVKRLLKKIPFLYRRVIQMRFFEGFSYEEIADEMNLTIQQVKNALHKAKKDLLELVELNAYKDINIK